MARINPPRYSNRWDVSATLALVIAVGCFACGSKPIPLIAVAGTTITIPIPVGFPTGFGRAFAGNPGPVGSPFLNVPAYSATSPLEDPQRGDLLFMLYNQSDELLAYLPLAYVTRVHMSPQSRAAGAGSMLYERGQALALVNIPASVVPSGQPPVDCEIRVIRFRREPGAGLSYQGVSPLPATSEPSGQNFLGWGDDSVGSGAASDAGGIPIRIVAGDDQNHFTPLRGWDDYAPYGVVWTDVSQELDELVPYPEFDFLVPQAGSALPKPAAWEAQIFYPRNKLRIRGVELRHPTRSAAIVRWQAEDPEASVGCGALPGFLEVKVIDPDRVTSGIRVAYELRNFDQSCGGRAEATMFGIWPGTFKAYDLDGVDITGAMNYEIPASSFF